MKKIIFVVLVLIAAGVAYGVYFQGKAANDFVADVTQNGNWSEARRQKDPAGYSKFVEKRLRGGIADAQTRRKTLAEQTTQLQNELEDRQSRLAKSGALLDQTLAALDKGEFPTDVFGVKYDEEQLRSQVVVLKREQEACQKAIEEFTKARKMMEQESRNLISRITENEDQIAMIEHNRTLFEARKANEESRRLIEDLADAFDADVQYAATDPVGSLDTLIKRAESEQTTGADPDDASVEQLLQEYRAKKNSAEPENPAE